MYANKPLLRNTKAMSCCILIKSGLLLLLDRSSVNGVIQEIG